MPSRRVLLMALAALAYSVFPLGIQGQEAPWGDGAPDRSTIEAGKRLAESLVKQLTGGDRIKARFMRQDFFEFEPSHTLWLMANHKPVVKGTDIAIWRRILLVPFDVTIPPERQDPALPDTLEAELPGILNWAIQGCLDWRREGLAAPDAVRAATKSYRDDMDVLGVFIEERCVLGPKHEIPAGELYATYRVWATVTGEEARSQTDFGRRLQERGLKRFKDPKTRRFGYRGIGLNIDSETVRNSSHVTPIESSHVETNEQTVTNRFAPDAVDSVLGVVK